MNIKQIAKAAGVSVATVSRVMNHPETVAPKTREKIRRVMEEAEYTPNWFAQGLNFNKTKTIGIVIPHMLHTSYMEVAGGVEEVARMKGYITFMCNVEKDPRMEREYISQLITRRVDGIILLFSSLEEQFLDQIEAEKIPVVLIGEHQENSRANSVKVDCRAGAAEMIAHLLEVGHRSIGFLQGGDPQQETQEMLIGFRNILKANGLEADENLIITTENSIEGGYISGKKLVSRGLPDAVFATSDEIAFGAMDAFKDSGLQIPEDIAVAGFGNNRMSNLVEPKLTTVELPFRKMGIYGARVLFDMIDGDAKEERHILLRPRMRIRKSCGHKERIGEMF
ncbi:MAG: LacI family DNA-binding transcriptional regulator [Firmicutes bacterium]|nr:LacI family DNA-binding transcriptional regulator [Bacillota bacterium]